MELSEGIAAIREQQESGESDVVDDVQLGQEGEDLDDIGHEASDDYEDESQDLLDRFDRYDRQMDELNARNNLLLRHIEHISQGLGEQQRTEQPAAPDAEEEPISHIHHQLDSMSSRLDEMGARFQEQGDAQSRDAYVRGVADWISQSDAMVVNEGSETYDPNYSEARDFLYEVQLQQWRNANPGMPEPELRQRFGDWFINWADQNRRQGNFLPNMIWNWAVESGYRLPPEGEAAGDSQVVDFEERRAEMEAQQVPDISGGGGRADESYANPQSTEDFGNMTREEYAAFLEDSGGLGGALKRLEKMVSSGAG